MKFSLKHSIIGAVWVCLSQGSFADGHIGNNAFRDPLQTPAAHLRGSLVAQNQAILALARVDIPSGRRLIAAGLRGLIIISDDNGGTWRQANVPVQSDLVALSFPSGKQGWAVGHDGVIIHTADGGVTWEKQFDGVVARSVLPNYYKKRMAAGESNLQPYLDEVQINTKDGATLPFLSVYFDNENVGYAVGAFGMIVKTDDAGKNWIPWLDHVDNKNFLNLNDIRKIGADIYVAGEQGSVYRLDHDDQKFVSISPTYKGSFFRIAGTENYLLAMGLNGTAFRSVDKGNTWQAVSTGAHASITAAALASDDMALVLVTEGGEVLAGDELAKLFKPVIVKKPMMFSDVIADANGQFVFSGFDGVERQQIDLLPK